MALWASSVLPSAPAWLLGCSCLIFYLFRASENNLSCTDQVGLSNPKTRTAAMKVLDRVLLFQAAENFKYLNIYHKHQKHLSTIRWRQKEFLVVGRWEVRFWRCPCWIWIPEITDGRCPSPSVKVVVLPLPFALSSEWGFKGENMGGNLMINCPNLISKHKPHTHSMWAS